MASDPLTEPAVRTRPAVARSRRSDLWLLGPVAAAYATAQLILAVPGTGLGWDETVYVSQVSGHAPAAFFSAPRARGISYLAAPVAAFTSSVTALRIHLALLSSAALLLSLWLWRRLLPTPVLALAGALFAGLWTALSYGPQAMPNLWVAFGSLMAVGCFLRAAGAPGDRRALAGLCAATALAAIMRPSDALWLALPLLCAAALVPRWRRPAPAAAVAGGVVLGGASWVVEAELHHGGLLARLHRAGEIQGGLGWHPALWDHLRALGGRTLCRPCDVPWSQPVTGLWWLALPVLVAGGLAVAYRGGPGPWRTLLVPTAAALSLALPYLLFVGYAAPRFLLPAYALLSLPVACCLARLFSAARGRPLALTALCLALAAHFALQAAISATLAARSRVTTAAFTAVAAELRAQGLRPPCVVSGEEAVRTGFRTGCASRQVGGHDGSVSAGGLVRLARTTPAAVLVAGGAPPPPWAAGWRPHDLPALPGLAGYRAYLAPSAHAAPPPAP
ncbi:hypothetical protein [Streptomyces sp. TN58]|uniref:hypothetical protein n=1 Tax=Streptomyces sp. TN58 TaxID=234612 RepID=UPI0009504B53|nr:hypothetical protein [Streptomyces sp. TN58]APU42906.1 hypothetical protein BSL84_27115 [Streptomyces sp. TN58]